MDVRALVALVVVSTGVFLIIIYLIQRFFNHLKKPPSKQQVTSLHNGISKQLFNRSDNPSLVKDAVENGWSRFAFNNFVTFSSSQSIIGYCGGARDVKDVEMMDIGWEVCRGSDDFMQKIRFNSGLRKVVTTTGSSMAAVSVIKAALPLPGPALGNSSPFPQEAYFEITILSLYEDATETEMSGKLRVDKGEGEKIMLIKGSPISDKASPESLIHLTNGNGNNNSNNNSNNRISTGTVFAKVEELKGRSGGKNKDEGKTEMFVVLSVGLTRGGSLPLKLPGSYPGSIGFNSDGSIYLEGMIIITA
ncbi:uncharacterized protein LOC143607913 [Bidens hawaiensis]|uniref:uncharacterized protein LOC143607913 n=1 Tax=Bidens hawaiensis TaxID=980011 RepID=UPI004049E17F